MDVQTEAIKLPKYTRSLTDLQTEIDHYNRMGALIVDAVLQAGIYYDTVVKPRLKESRMNFPWGT